MTFDKTTECLSERKPKRAEAAGQTTPPRTEEVGRRRERGSDQPPHW